MCLEIKVCIMKLILLPLDRMDIAPRILFYFNLNKFALCVSTLEPGSIVEKQGWEVCWAKPIGVKNLDRQQYICEAATNSNSISQLQKTKTSRPKQARNKKNHIEIAHEDDSVYSARLEILQNFVKERFDATCTFDCVPMSDASGYIGTVSVLIKKFVTSYLIICVR